MSLVGGFVLGFIGTGVAKILADGGVHTRDSYKQLSENEEKRLRANRTFIEFRPEDFKDFRFD